MFLFPRADFYCELPTIATIRQQSITTKNTPENKKKNTPEIIRRGLGIYSLFRINPETFRRTLGINSL